MIAASLWLGAKALTLSENLSTASALAPKLKGAILANDQRTAAATVGDIGARTHAAREVADDPLWVMATALPWVGPNLRAASEAATSADDVVRLGAAPMVDVLQTLDWSALAPNKNGVDLVPLADANPKIAAAAEAVRQSADRIDGIDVDKLLPEIKKPLEEARTELRSLRRVVGVAADAAALAPDMMGAQAPRNYLLIIQNNAEARASGGIPGALAVLTLDKGRLTLGSQSSAGELGIMSPPFPVDAQQQHIYSTRLGKYMQDVNLTPDFPTAAATAQAMWEKKTALHVNGVISIDPVVLSYILQTTGPVAIKGPELDAVRAAGLPTELDGSNVVSTLLSEVYAKIPQPQMQDSYFAGVAKEVFAALSDGKGEAKGLITGITRGAEEGRVLLWSDEHAEQEVITRYSISGSVAGPSISPAQFGVYFNDGTGAKMDYYIKHTVQLVKECPLNGYEQTTVRITSTNTAPPEAGKALPSYVTGGGAYGVPPGSVQTNVIAYGPVQANVESAKLDGQRTEFAPYIHAGRPVGVLGQRLAPGESKTIEFTFDKIVQHTEPNLFVTPSVQSVKDVTLPTENATCG
ncbi:DUF4012 domain-containing protein [Arthrobacter sp. DNA4]|uniref:DUF4012 domain-containing protein n=1 Tax=Micrococcaceae TaxID=1268 RepID=UPI0020CB91F2|nr:MULTISPECIES: DUF4012 domain-containing protein [Micrococcaceae]UTT68802.1 DUF4012 domain-containing protein [Arthrobacter sp. DNA4]WRT13050.1 DUF4012 domain-containing protein [Pseudarthrobacter sp. LT1]